MREFCCKAIVFPSDLINAEIESLISKIFVFLHSKFLLASFRNVKTGFQNSHFPLNFLVKLGTQMSFTQHLGYLDVGFAPVLSAPTWSSVLVACEERRGLGRCASGSHPRALQPEVTRANTWKLIP